jgi:tripartite-type tricarboxylate transporter receptor subunit TctC
VGVASVLPGPGIIRDFNKQNGLSTINVSLASSSQVAAAILNGDVDWGLVQVSVAELMVEEGRLDCPLTFIPNGTTLVKKDKYIANYYDMKVPDLHCTFLLVIKTKDLKVREAVVQAAQSKEFNAFLEKGKWVNVNLNGKFVQKDVDSFNAYIKKMIEYTY